MNCLFCDTGKSFTTIEHIVPESLGNDDLLLEKEVCDKCQNYLSQIEKYVLDKTPIGFWRVLLTVRTKKNKLPKVDFTKTSETKGVFPDSSIHHDNVSFQSHPDYSTEILFPETVREKLNEKAINEFKYVITPKVIHEIGRFLGKIGIELLCHSDRLKARDEQFKELRQYVRKGSLKDIWPIFHATKGTIEDLFMQDVHPGYTDETVTCYEYAILEVGPYIVLSFVVGIDNWFICLNQQFPHPGIALALGHNVKPIWYPKQQWSKP